MEPNMSDIVFELHDVSLTFKDVGKSSLLYSTGRRISKKKGAWQFKALNNINLRIEKGKTIGLIGRNGAGKTTLLRVLAGIYAPDGGTIVSNSNSISLLSLGLGFDNYATGFDNIYLSSLLQGHTMAEVDSKVHQIVEYADIGDFINSPMKTYSSGMKLRLAFSIAVHFEPEVLLIDEALSVGDAEFQKKSTARIYELIHDLNRTVIIASHGMNFLNEVADRVIWLDKGEIRMEGDPKTAIDAYLQSALAKKT